MSLLQSLGLLLVPLFDLLPFDLVSILSLQASMVMLLTPLEFLTLPCLFGEKLFLLLLVLSVQIGITGVGKSRVFKRRKIFGMDCLARETPSTTIR